MKISEIAFTAYPSTDMARSRAFYEGVLGLSLSRNFGDEDNPTWIEYDIGSGCLAVVTGAGEAWPPANGGPAVALEVEDFEAAVADLKAAGVKFLWEPAEYPACWMTVVLDPDENRLCIHHRKS